MLTFLSLAHMVDATQCTCLSALVHMVDATQCTCLSALAHMVDATYASQKHVSTIYTDGSRGWKNECCTLGLKHRNVSHGKM